ncbi:Kinase, PIKK [Spironucleus salmonicida]|nr:Kinase, PIKK [Spironucleus salmonicida]
MQKQLTLSQIRFSLFDSGSVGQQQDNNYKTIDSIACWSVICFLLGIGDRHNNNILFDPVTQTIHNIDFEAIFYHAKDLPIPDACDIRLTPFIIHLLGPARFESRFKQTSQNLLRIIQQNSHMFLTSFTAVSTMLSKNKTDIVMKIFENICSNIEEQYWVSINRSIDEIRLGQMFPPWAPLE